MPSAISDAQASGGADNKPLTQREEEGDERDSNFDSGVHHDNKHKRKEEGDERDANVHSTVAFSEVPSASDDAMEANPNSTAAFSGGPSPSGELYLTKAELKSPHSTVVSAPLTWPASVEEREQEAIHGESSASSTSGIEEASTSSTERKQEEERLKTCEEEGKTTLDPVAGQQENDIPPVLQRSRSRSDTVHEGTSDYLEEMPKRKFTPRENVSFCRALSEQSSPRGTMLSVYPHRGPSLDSGFQVMIDASLSKKYGEMEHAAAVVIQRSWKRLQMAKRYGCVLKVSRAKRGEVSRVDMRVELQIKRRDSHMPDAKAVTFAMDLERHEESVLSMAAYLFNLSPQSGIRYCCSQGIIPSSTPSAVGDYLLADSRLSKRQIGNYLSKNDNFIEDVRLYFMEQLSFEGKTVLSGLRELMNRFHLTGESNQVQRTLETFAFLYHKANPTNFKSSDTALVLAYSMLMLNTDAHDENVKSKMTQEQFIRNNRGIDDLGDPDLDMQKEVYEQIQAEEIKTPVSAELEKCLEVVGRITGTRQFLAPPHRVFITEFTVTRICDVYKRGARIVPHGRRKVFLFNDVIMFCKQEKSVSRTITLKRSGWNNNYGGKYTLTDMISLVKCRAFEVRSKLHENAFVINYNGEAGDQTMTLKIFKGIERGALLKLVDSLASFLEKVEHVRAAQKLQHKTRHNSRSSLISNATNNKSVNMLSSSTGRGTDNGQTAIESCGKDR